jgi:hypothetical protein
MTRSCHYCGASIDTRHDEHYYCKCGGSYTAVCTWDHIANKRCPQCGEKLKHRDDSYQKKVFESPGTRELLGF